MTIEQTIKKAIEGGWNSEECWVVGKIGFNEERMFLDPSFWRCLGKAMEMERENLHRRGSFRSHSSVATLLAPIHRPSRRRWIARIFLQGTLTMPHTKARKVLNVVAGAFFMIFLASAVCLVENILQGFLAFSYFILVSVGMFQVFDTFS